MKVLFICNQRQNRSKTAAELFKDRFQTRSAGLYNDRPITKHVLSWADVIVTMEDSQRSEMAKRYPNIYLQKRIPALDIPDIYRYNQPELIHILKSKVGDMF
jgi:predicted protein tyrosine phosphatase